MGKQNILAGLVSSLVFLILFLVLKWHLVISLLLAVGVFAAVYLLAKPVRKIGNIELENLVNGMELHEIYQEAVKDLKQLGETIEAIQDGPVRQKADSLYQVGQDILRYLENNPREISKSRHFLDYYLDTARKLTGNYVQLKKANISADKFANMTDKTLESLDLLEKVFVNQRDGYHEDKLVALEVETDLLEKTIKLGGELK